MDLTEFLLARIAEDEAMARAAEVEAPDPWTIDQYAPSITTDAFLMDANQCPLLESEGGSGTGHVSVVTHIARHDPARVLAECEAKRRRLEAFDKLEGEADSDEWRWISSTIERLLAIEALPYADHPDFQEDWRA